jgi:glycosyltransferase involved in cell wall biosynthesis
MTLVTVGIPFHDEERFLEPAIRSVLAQTFENLELLLVDDGSTDRSLEIARSFSDPRVNVLPPDGERRFLAARLNEITRRARGEVIARMDGDDVAHPERLARQVAVMQRDASYDAVGTWAALIGEDEEPFAITEAASLPATLATALTRGLFPHATLVARRAWLAANPYDETLTRAEDRDLWCRTVQTSRFHVVPAPLYVVRTHERDASFVADYLASQEQNRELFVRYGRAAMGTRRAAVQWAASHAKGLVMRAAVQAHLARRLVRRRGRLPSEEEKTLVREALAAARGERWSVDEP